MSKSNEFGCNIFSAWLGLDDGFMCREDCGDVSDSYNRQKTCRCKTAPVACGGVGQTS